RPLRFRELAGRDVLTGSVQPDDPTGAVTVGREPGLDHAYVAVRTNDPELRLRAIARTDPWLPAAPEERAVVRMNRREEERLVDRDGTGLVTEDAIRLIGPAQRAAGP